MNHSRLLSEGKFSDFTISCRRYPSDEPHHFPVHRVILSGRSKLLDELIENESRQCGISKSSQSTDCTENTENAKKTEIARTTGGLTGIKELSIVHKMERAATNKEADKVKEAESSERAETPEATTQGVDKTEDTGKPEESNGPRKSDGPKKADESDGPENPEESDKLKEFERPRATDKSEDTDESKNNQNSKEAAKSVEVAESEEVDKSKTALDRSREADELEKNVSSGTGESVSESGKSSGTEKIKIVRKAEEADKDKESTRTEVVKNIKNARKTDKVSNIEEFRGTNKQIDTMIEARPEIMALTLSYLYTDKYPHGESEIDEIKNDNPATAHSFDNIFMCHLDLLAISERFGLPEMYYHARHALIKIFSEVKANPEKHEQSLKEALVYLYAENTRGYRSVRKLVIWLCDRRLDRRWLRKTIRPPPDFIWDLCREVEVLLCCTGDQCKQCSRVFDPALARFLVVEDGEDKFRWMRCFCLFRGLCRAECKKHSSPWPGFAYCERCAGLELASFLCEKRRTESTLPEHDEPITCHQMNEGGELILRRVGPSIQPKVIEGALSAKRFLSFLK